MNTEDDGARGDDEQPRQPLPNGADEDTGPESIAGESTPPPAEPPVEPLPADQPSAEQLGAETAVPGEQTPGEPVTPAADSAEPADTEEAGTQAPSEEQVGHETRAGEWTETPRETAEDTGAAEGSGPRGDEYARRFLDSVDGFLGTMFREASEFIDRNTGQATPPPRAETPPPGTEGERTPEDYAARVLDSVEGWMSDFFRGASMARTAAGFGRAAAGSAFRGARQRADDVWAQATSAHDADPSRECRYCPFCQTMAVVRNSRPELYEQIGDTAKTLVDLIRQAAEQSRRPRR